MYRELLGGSTGAQQAAQPLKTARASLVSTIALAGREKTADAQSTQDGSGKQPLHDENPAAVTFQKSSATTPTQPQAASEPTALAALAALAASRSASNHQDMSDLPAIVTDSPARKKAAGPKGSKNKEQSAKCVFASHVQCHVAVLIMVVKSVACFAYVFMFSDLMP